MILHLRNQMLSEKRWGVKKQNFPFFKKGEVLPINCPDLTQSQNQDQNQAGSYFYWKDYRH